MRASGERERDGIQCLCCKVVEGEKENEARGYGGTFLQ